MNSSLILVAVQLAKLDGWNQLSFSRTELHQDSDSPFFHPEFQKYSFTPLPRHHVQPENQEPENQEPENQEPENHRSTVGAVVGTIGGSLHLLLYGHQPLWQSPLMQSESLEHEWPFGYCVGCAAGGRAVLPQPAAICARTMTNRRICGIF